MNEFRLIYVFCMNEAITTSAIVVHLGFSLDDFQNISHKRNLATNTQKQRSVKADLLEEIPFKNNSLKNDAFQS